MKIPTIPDQYNKIFIIVIFIFATTLSYYKNIFYIAEDNFFKNFQLDSEALVVGKIINDRENISQSSFLGLIYTKDTDPTKQYLQQYKFIKRRGDILDRHCTIEDISDNIWDHGFHKEETSVCIKINDDNFDRYIGRNFIFANESRTIKDIYKIDNDSYILEYYGEKFPSNMYFTREILISGKKINKENLIFSQYMSQYGLQGKIFSLLYNKIYLNIETLKFFTAFLFVVCIYVLSQQYSKYISKEFSIVFLGVSFLSPWMTAFAGNLYWIPFSWFLPAIFSGMFYLAKTKNKKYIYFILLTLSFIFKCLSGYEYISSIILFAAAPFIYNFLISDNSKEKIIYFKGIVIVFISGVIAFIISLIIHAGLGSENFYDILKMIFEKAKIRTYSNANEAPIVYQPSLKASFIDVLLIYIHNWHTDIIKFIPGYTFQLIVILTILAILLVYFTSKNNIYKKYISLLLCFLLPALSWYIIAKSHSYIHTHMNFILLYFGLIHVIFYIFFEICIFL